MTNPTPANDWSALDLPVLTDVVDVEPASAPDVPVYDFTAELDALAQAVPGEDVPELVLPPELSLDDVLGDDLPADDASLSASQLIERLPSLDLEVDLPAELVLEDVLPGLDRQRPPQQAEAAAVEEFEFSLDEAPSPAPAADEASGLGALFARASFEPLVPPADSTPLSDSATVDRLTAQLDDFDLPAEMPELPGDAFLSEARDGEVPAEVFAADSVDDAWASTWTPPPPVVPTLEAALPEVPTLGPEAGFDSVPTLSAAPLADWPQPESAFADVPVMQVEAALAPVSAPVAESLPADEVVLDWLEDAAPPAGVADTLGFDPAANLADTLGAAHDAPPEMANLPPWAQPDASLQAAPAVPAEAETPAAAMPWDQPAAAVADIPSLALSVDDILASLQAAPAPAPAPAHASAQAEAVAAADDVLPPPAAIDMPVAAVTQPWPAQAEPSPLLAEPALTPFAEEATMVSASPLDNATLQQPVSSAAFDAAPQAAAFDTAPQPEPEPTLAAAPPLTSISLDSLPTGVLGGGLGLSVAEVPPAAALGQPAAALPGGGEWLATRSAFNADDKEVELAWARDLGAEPPLDLDQLPQAEALPASAPVIAEVIRVRRTMPLPASEPAPATHVTPPAAQADAAPLTEPAPAVHAAMLAPQAEAPAAAAGGHDALPEEAIRIEAVSAALPMPAAEPQAVKPDLDEEVLIEALYARVLPRMKVELTLWMQDALEQQAKQLMAGVMKQLKEDFDMMLAESLRSALREAMDEAAGKLGARDD